MADDTNNAGDAGVNDAAGSVTDTDTDTATDTGGSDDNGMPEGARKALAAARRDAREAEKARKALEAQVNEYKQRDMTEQQKLEARATEAEKAAESSTRELNRIRAALAAGLDATDADLVTGSTPAEMKASATRLAERFGATAVRTSFDGGPRAPAAKAVDMNDLIRRQRSTR